VTARLCRQWHVRHDFERFVLHNYRVLCALHVEQMQAPRGIPSRWLTISVSRLPGTRADDIAAQKPKVSDAAQQNNAKRKKKAKNNRPKHNHSKIATDVLKEWLDAHMHDPFPSVEVKAGFADRTGSCILHQVTKMSAHLPRASNIVSPKCAQDIMLGRNID